MQLLPFAMCVGKNALTGCEVKKKFKIGRLVMALCLIYFFGFYNHHFHIHYNVPCLPPKILHNHCFQFLQGIRLVPGDIEDNGYAKFWGVNKVHHGLCENGELS